MSNELASVSTRYRNRLGRIFAIALWGGFIPGMAFAQSPQPQLDFFESRVRPLLLDRCGQCHIQEESGGFSLQSQETMLRGGDSGPAVVVGNPQQSLLIAAIKRESDSPMPPEKPLSADEIAVLEHWVAAGAHWSEPPTTDPAVTPEAHWAFQPIASVEVPPAGSDDWSHTSIDPFILQSLESAGLAPAAEAAPAQWIRRVTFSLTGLPPTKEEVDSFVQSTAADKYEVTVDRLLDSPRYGQHQARMWLDLARYSDTKGYVYAREERFWVHAWNYRDWVVNALNQDMSYDRFLTLQLAADRVADRAPDDLAAMGYLTIGRRFLGVKHDIIDDRIDVVCRGTMALTVGCARCHNHKFDPIPTTDYYALYGVFDSSSERIEPLTGAATVVTDPEHAVKQKRDALDETLQQRRTAQAKLVRDRFADYLWAQTELHKYPAEGFDQVFAKEDLLPSFVRRLQSFLRISAKENDPIFVAWRAYLAIPNESFSEQVASVTESLQAGKLGPVHPRVIQALQQPPESLREVADRYGQLFKEVDEQWSALEVEALSESDRPLWQILFAEDGPCQVPNRGVVHTESFFDSGTCSELWKLQGDLDRAIIQAGASAPFAVTLVDNPSPVNARVFRRGNPLDQGEEVPRRFLTLLNGENEAAFSDGSGRLELAQHIVDPKNPLTSRVIVNRIWAQHFGKGLVPTTSDFGRRADPPSHPQLLDFLAQQFMEKGWSLKTLHRILVLSATYRQNSVGPSDPEMLTRYEERDPENRLLWRMNPHRLTFEELRDSLLSACGNLDDSLNGPASQILQPPFSNRRTLYGLIDRQFLPASFRIFDFASPDLHIPERNETTIPQQALFLMNHPLMLHQVELVADELKGIGDVNIQVESLFSSILRRPPTVDERAEALAFLSSEPVSEQASVKPTSVDWQYGFGELDESAQRVSGFTPLPHFNGDAWQGGESYPDGALGWVQLTSKGGHPGNDRQHAIVRRWVAPQAMQIEIHSSLTHEPAPGDGVRAFVVSSTMGIIKTEKAHQQTRELSTESISVAAGETIDFVVDIDQQLNSDQFLWSIQIDAGDLHWDSEQDFTPNLQMQLSPLAQLAQIMFCSNEFVFVD